MLPWSQLSAMSPDMTAPYARVYLTVRDDPKFEGVYEDDALFAAWVRLLMAAEQAWPSSCDVPAWCSPKAFTALVDAGIIDACGRGRFKVHGLDAERAKRSDKAANAARARYDPVAVETGDPVVVYASLAGGFPSPKAMDWLDDLTGKYGAAAVLKALGEAKGPPSKIIGEVQDILRAEARTLSQREKDAEAKKVATHRLDGMLARRMEWFRNTGKWDEAWGEKPS